MLSEFKEFIAKGNVMDMAVGIIIGAAFTAIVNSMVADLVNPFIGLFLGGVDLNNMFYVLGSGEFATLAAAEEAGTAVIAYGRFFMAIINFLVIAFMIFMLVRSVNRARAAHEEEAEEAGPSELDVLLEIRDSLKK